jgi:hypothetical protein
MSKVIGLAVTVFVVLSMSAWAQDTATIVGTVMDSSNAVIPAAKVTVANPDKGFTRQLASNAAGEYTAAKIPIGTYVVTAEASGFQKSVRTEISLSVGQTQRVDLQMTVGQMTQEVTVTGNLPHVETETAAISDVVTGNQIQNLELNGRNFTALALLVPGAAPDNGLEASHVGITANLNISFNGSRMQYNNWELDGGPNTDDTSGGTTNTFPNIDSIAEFRISTSTYGADMGRHAGAVIEVATKSGTKDFHGSMFEFLRNDKLDANDWFINRQRWDGLDVLRDCNGNAAGPCNAPKTPLKWNDYGYTFGGPFYIPGHYNTSKTKTFFFWSHNWRKYREGSVISAGVPSVRMRQGDFSECHAPGALGSSDPGSPNYNPVVASGCVLPIDPATGTTFAGDIVPIDPNSQAMLSALVPLPNNGAIGYLRAPSLPTNWRQEQIRVDQNISDKTSVFVRFTQDTWNSVVVPSLWTGSSYDTVATNFLAPTKSAVAHITHTFKPNLMNEFVMGFTNDHWHLIPQVGPSNPARSINKPSSWTVGNLFPPNAGVPLLPALSISGGLPFGGFYQDEGVLAYSSQPFITSKDNVVWSLGKHTLKFGYYFQYLRTYAPTRQDTQGIMSFSSGSAVSTGNGLADMYLGRLGSYTEATAVINGVPTGGLEFTDYRQYDLEPYVQDDWKVNRKLTLNLGARYYYFTTLHDYLHPTIDSAFDPSKYNPALEAALDSSGNLVRNAATGQVYDYRVFGNGLLHCDNGGVPAGCTNSTRGTLSPRFGFAFDPTGNGKTVVRGGYGVYIEIGNWNESQAGAIAGNPPAVSAPSIYNVPGFANIQAPADLLSGPIGPASINTLPGSWNWPNIQQFSLSVQHEFSGNNLLTVGYVGTLARHLARSRNMNQVLLGSNTMNVPALAGLTGTNPGDPSNGIPGDLGQTLCTSSGDCDVQKVLTYNEASSIFFVPYRGYGGIASREDSAISAYNSLQVNFRHAFSHGLTFQTAYTWSHAIDDSTSTYFQTGVDDYHLSRWRATSGLNRTQILVMNYVYDLPFFKNSPSALARRTLGGWQISGITSFFTGQPVDFSCGINGLSTGAGTGVRCNSLGRVAINKGVYNDPQFGPTPTWVDPSNIGQVTFDQLAANNQAGMFGTMGRNPLTGPGRNNWDLALMKNLQLPWFKGEHSTLQFRWETFNSFNHPQWKGVSVGCSGATLPGQPCTGADNIGNGEVSGTWSPRVMQFGLKVMF